MTTDNALDTTTDNPLDTTTDSVPAVSILTDVLRLLDDGFAVFPLIPYGKYPFRSSHAYKDATNRPHKVRNWWSTKIRANVAIYTGHKVFVFDVDGESGQRSLTDLELRHGPLPQTRTVATKKGRHHYFVHPDFFVKSSQSRIGKAIDIRGDDGFVVGPPSRLKDGFVYRWENDNHIVNAPDWLLAELRRV